LLPSYPLPAPYHRFPVIRFPIPIIASQLSASSSLITRVDTLLMCSLPTAGRHSFAAIQISVIREIIADFLWKSITT